MLRSATSRWAKPTPDSRPCGKAPRRAPGSTDRRACAPRLTSRRRIAPRLGLDFRRGFGIGSWTLKNKLKERGLEPDECYSIGDPGVVPELCFEVVVTGVGIEKLDVYLGLAVREVLFWEDDRFSLFRLGARGYEPVERSLLFPELDLSVLASFMIAPGSQTTVVRAFRDSLRAGT